MPEGTVHEAGSLFSQVLQRYGLGMAVGAASFLIIAGLFVWLLMWVFKNQSKMHVEASNHETTLLSIISSHAAAITEHNKTTVDFRDEVKRGMTYQREEHAGIIKVIDKLSDKIDRFIERQNG